MIETTKLIAQSWVKTHQSSTAPAIAQSKNGSLNSTMAIPIGTKDKLDGSLVEHMLKVCEYLELEQKQMENCVSTYLDLAWGTYVSWASNGSICTSMAPVGRTALAKEAGSSQRSSLVKGAAGPWVRSSSCLQQRDSVT